jgi:hypothetical protein
MGEVGHGDDREIQMALLYPVLSPNDAIPSFG